MNEETQELYGKLRGLEGIKGDLSYDGRMITWRFHKYLQLEIFVDGGEAYIGINNGKTHYHPDAETVFDELCDILNDKTVFVFKAGMTGRYLSGIYRRDYFEKHKKWIKFGFGVRCVTSRGMIE